MTSALDASYSLEHTPTGVAVYSSNIIRGLSQVAQPGDRFLLCYRLNRFGRALRAPLPGGNCSRRLLAEPLCPLYRHQVSVFHGLNQRLPRTRFKRAVTTFHDLFVMTGDYATPEFRARFAALARDAAQRSDRIIAVSGHTADLVSGLLDYPREQIHVIYHGVNRVAEFPTEQLLLFRRRYELDRPFLLHVGALQERKNILRLITAFELLKTPCLLVLAGSGGYGIEKIDARIEVSPARDRIRRLGYVNGEILAKLYRTADALVFPSLEEGFGIPILEAMSAALPVVTSDRSALREVAGEAAILVNPEDVGSIAAALEQVLTDSEKRQALAEAGRQRVSQFSWLKAAHETWQVHRSLI